MTSNQEQNNFERPELGELLDDDIQEPKESTILVVDDQDMLREAFSQRLDKHGFQTQVVKSGEDALRRIRDDLSIDLVLLDIELPGVDGFEVLRSIRKKYGPTQLPIIMVTSRRSEEDILQALDLGANDYVNKETDFAITRARIQSQLRIKSAVDRIVEISQTDPLTSLLNRRAFYERLADEQSRCDRTKEPFGILLLDIDHFKKVNDNLGHQAGDTILEELASRLTENTRSIDIIARFGGEEFILLLPGNNREETYQVAEKLRQHVADEPFQTKQKEVDVTISVGWAAQTPGDPLATDDLIKQADDALYEAKETGRNRVCPSL